MRKIALGILISLIIGLYFYVMSFLPTAWVIIITVALSIVIGIVFHTYHKSDEKLITEVENILVESRILIDKYRFDQARVILIELVGRIKDNKQFKNELARAYNNIGITFNQLNNSQDIDEALKYFKLSQELNPSLKQARINEAMAYINKNDSNLKGKGIEIIEMLWELQKERNEIDSRLISAKLWVLFSKQEPKIALEFVEKSSDNIKELINKNATCLHILALIYLAQLDTHNALRSLENAIEITEDAPELEKLKGEIFLQESVEFKNEYDLLPTVTNKELLGKADSIFKEAEKHSVDQNKPHLINEIIFARLKCAILIGSVSDALAFIEKLNIEEFEGELKQIVITTISRIYVKCRLFEDSLNLLTKYWEFLELPYIIVRTYADQFMRAGAPEQSLELLRRIESEAEEKKDIYYFSDLSKVLVLLDRSDQAIISSKKAKELAINSELEDDKKQELFGESSVILARVIFNTKKDTSGRLLKELLDFQKAFPSLEIVKPFQLLDATGKLTSQMKNMLSKQFEDYQRRKSIFEELNIPVNLMASVSNQSIPVFLSQRDDPTFNIPFTNQDSDFMKKQESLFRNKKGLVFDYQSLLDLSITNSLILIEEIESRIYVHEELFDLIQIDLLNSEILELRNLWEWIRKSKKVIIFEHVTSDQQLLKEYEETLPSWQINSISFSIIEDYPLVTNDFRMLLHYQKKNIGAINIIPILKHFLNNGIIDSKMWANKIGILASRFYSSLSYNAEELIQIVLEDDRKITPRSYHLVNQIFYPGANASRFSQVFLEFINKLWKLGVLVDEKIEWVKFLSKTLTKYIVDSKLEKDHDHELQVRLISIWRVAIGRSNKEELEKLLGIIDDTLSHDFLKEKIVNIKAEIKNRLDCIE